VCKALVERCLGFFAFPTTMVQVDQARHGMAVDSDSDRTGDRGDCRFTKVDSESRRVKRQAKKWQRHKALI